MVNNEYNHKIICFIDWFLIKAEPNGVRLGDKCVGPDFVIGTCRDINECPLILNKLLLDNSTDEDVKDYIKDSEEICAYTESHVYIIKKCLEDFFNFYLNFFNIRYVAQWKNHL